MTQKKRKPSPSGFYKVELSRSYPDPAGDFVHKPGDDLTVDELTLVAMEKAGVVQNARPAD